MPVNLSSYISTIKAGSGDVVSTYEGWVWEHTGWDSSSGCSSSTYDRQNTFFCVPTGFNCARFELWGGGGGGGPARCCAIGIPGNAGAYARKCMTGLTAGTCYLICTGAISCLAGCTTRGVDGPPVCAAGTGLTNFFANGGCGGLEWCMAHANACFLGNVVWNRESNVTGNIVCTTWGPGADMGCFGLPGYIERVAAGAAADDYCAFRYFSPFPAYKDGLTAKGGWVATCVVDNIAGYGATDYDLSFNSPFCSAGGGALAFNYKGFSGVGQPGAAQKAGGCCYGSQYSPARIKITYGF